MWPKKPIFHRFASSSLGSSERSMLTPHFLFRFCCDMVPDTQILPASVLHWTRNWSNGAHWLVGFFFLFRRKKFVRSYHRGLYAQNTEQGAYYLRLNSVKTPYELFSPRQKKNPTSQCAPLSQFLVQWSTLAGRICHPHPCLAACPCLVHTTPYSTVQSVFSDI